MKKTLYTLALALLAFTSCNDSDYELDKIVPQEYHKIMVLKDSGKHTVNVQSGDATVDFTVLKSGSDPSLTASVNVRTLTDAELNEEYCDLENVNYRQLPADCYQLSATTLDFSSADRYKTVSVTLHSQQIKAKMQEDATATWTLPLKIESVNDSINAESNRYFIIVK